MDWLFYLFHLLLVTPMTNVLVAMARVFGGNFGVAIIVFTLAMRIITWPMTSSQYKQSRAMQAIQPQMQELQKKYKGKDPKKLQSETMALYKEAGVNPLGCLLPMVAQMPIWIALYQVIRVALGSTPESYVSLSQTLYPFPYVHEAVPLSTHFLVWNLAQPDTTFLLPAIVAASTYVQQKLISPTPATAATTPQQQQQQQTQQMMSWMMPLMFGVFALQVPAGLALYWFISAVAGIVMQYFYMGRTVDWRSILSISAPAAPAPGAKARGAAAPVTGRDEKKPPKSAAARDNGSAESGEPVMITGRQESRRKRHGRRRGKR